jgi:hypothetical protein
MGKSKVFLFGVLIGGILNGVAHGSNVLIPDEQFDRLVKAFHELSVRINTASSFLIKEEEPKETVLPKKKKRSKRKGKRKQLG